MSNEFKRPRDSFTFSLGGLSTFATVAYSPAISGERINRLRDEQRQQVRDAGSDERVFWCRWRRQPA